MTTVASATPGEHGFSPWQDDQAGHRVKAILSLPQFAGQSLSCRNLLAIILAAGKGKRMASDLPKVLVPVCGRPMIRYVIDAVRAAGVERIVGRRRLSRRIGAAGAGGRAGRRVRRADRAARHRPRRDDVPRARLPGTTGPVLILAGDSPMVQVSSLRALLAEFAARRPACLLGTATKPDPTGLGRIVRDADGDFLAIVEEKDATPAERAITEVNMSTYVFQAGRPALGASSS